MNFRIDLMFICATFFRLLYAQINFLYIVIDIYTHSCLFEVYLLYCEEYFAILMSCLTKESIFIRPA